MARKSLPQSSSPESKIQDSGPWNGDARKTYHAVGREQAPDAAGGLHLVATPIGNLGDITLRALDVLASADAILCEDTRVTRKLLSRYNISTPSLVYNDHNAQRMLPRLMKRLNEGNSLALVTDAGTPLISDPGYRLVEATIAADIPLHMLPGASAALAGLVLSGLPSDGFFFAGFPPTRTTARQKRFAELAAIPGSIIFFESARRLAASLSDLHQVLGDRPAAIAREITKLHEEVHRGSLGTLAKYYAEEGAPRGEIVITVAPPTIHKVDNDTLRAKLTDALAGQSLRDAVAEVSTETGRARREVYRLALEISSEKPDT